MTGGRHGLVERGGFGRGAGPQRRTFAARSVTGPRFAGASPAGRSFGERGALAAAATRPGFSGDFRGGWNGWRGDGWSGWRGGDWDDRWGWGLGIGLTGFALGVTFGNPDWGPYWDPFWDPYGYAWGPPYGGYWGVDYGFWSPGYFGYWGPGYAAFDWGDPYADGWGPPYDAVYPYWRPRVWRQYRRPIEAVSYVPEVEPAVYTVAVRYDLPADCSGGHYVWDDDLGGYVFRPYAYPC